MGNMAHCRFYNTANDLEDCIEHINDKDLGKEEARARLRLIALCVDIAEDFAEEI